MDIQNKCMQLIASTKTTKRIEVEELKSWKENLLFQSGKPLKIGMPQLIIQTDAYNVLELIAVKLVELTFTRGKSVTTTHLQIENTTALSYLVEVGVGGGGSQSRIAASSQGNMGLSARQSNSSYSRVLKKQSEYSG